MTAVDAVGPGPWACSLTEPHAAPAMKVPRNDFPGELDPRRPRGILEDHPRAGLELLSRMHERVPLVRARLLEQQALDGAAARIAAAEQPRRKHARVVGDHQVAGRQQLRQIADRSFLPPSGGAIDDEQPRRPARDGMLRDLRLGQVEVEVRDEQRRRVAWRPKPWRRGPGRGHAKRPLSHCQATDASQIASSSGSAMSAPNSVATPKTNR